GTLNHTALTVEALRRRDVHVAGIVLNENEGATLAERTNPEVLADMTDLSVETVPPITTDQPEAVVEGVRSNVSRDLLPVE
ncbi:MAG: AAA family ATPase, partial [Haloarculaceae archaeon]